MKGRDVAEIRVLKKVLGRSEDTSHRNAFLYEKRREVDIVKSKGSKNG